MTQLTLTDPLTFTTLALPETSHDKYQCYEMPLSVQLDMISGRRVSEMRNKVYIVHYEYDRMTDAEWRALAAILRNGQSFNVQFVDDMNNELSSVFLCTSLTPPTFAFSIDGRAIWHNISFELREVTPHA